MNVQTGAVGAAPPPDAPSSTSPPGDPPDGFGEVLGTQLQKLGDSHTQPSTRTADAEGAREEGAAAADEQTTGDGQAADQPADAALPLGQAPATAQGASTEAPDPNALEGQPAKPASARLGSSTAAGAQANLLEGQVAPGATAAGAADTLEGQTVGGDKTPPASAPAARPAAPTVQLPPEPTHSPAVKETTVVSPGRSVEPQDQLVDAAAKLDRPRGTQTALPVQGRTDQALEGQSATAARGDVKQDAAQQAVGLAESHRGETGGRQAGASPDGGQSPRQGASQLATPAATTAAQPATPTEAAVVAAKAEAPLRARARLGELADVAGTLIRVAARDGKTTARITLRPVELGEVEIRLRYHAGGVSADVVAESRQAAQLLTNASSELRKSLESQGLTVHWLDVRAGGDERRAWEELGQSRNGTSDGDPGVDDTEELTPIEASGLPLAAGAVDVLA